MNEIIADDLQRQAGSALMHPVTLVALVVLLMNDLLFKALWPGAWGPGKLSDLTWMMFAPPVLAYILSFATQGSSQGQRVAFAVAYAGLPLLYAAFNTFEIVHDAILRVLGSVGGDGPRSPLDPTDSLVIPLAMVAALWVWRRPPLEVESIRARLALLGATAAGLASVATSYATDFGVRDVGRTASGTLGAYTSPAYPPNGSYKSKDGGLTWVRMADEFVPLETQEWRELEVKTPSGDVFIVDVVYAQIIREQSERELSEHELRDITSVSRGQDDHLTAYGPSASREVVYSYEYLYGGGNRWMQALDKRDIEDRAIALGPYNLFYDDQSGNLIVAMGLQGVVVVASDGTSTRVAVGPYSPTDFSLASKVRTLLGSLLHRDTVVFTGLAFLLTFSFAALTLPVSTWPRFCFALAAAISAFLALSAGVYPQVLEAPWESGRGRQVVGNMALLLSGFGLLPLILVIVGLAFAQVSRRQVLAVAAATIGMLPLIALGALVLFEKGAGTASLVAVGLVGLASLGLWAYQKRTQT